MQSAQASPHIVWIHPGRLEKVLSSATHLETTRELRELGAKVTLFAHGERGLTRLRGVEVSCLPKEDVYLFGQTSFHWRVLDAIRRMEPSPDVVLFHQESALWMLPALRWRRLRGLSRPLAVMDTRSVHMPPEQGETVRGWLRRHYFEAMNRLANRWCDGQTAITERMAKRVQIPRDSLWGTWPSGVVPEAFQHSPERHWPRPGEPLRLIYIGSLHRERNLIGLAKAVLRARASGAHLELSLVGEGDEWSDLEALAEEADGVLSLSRPVPHEQVPELLSHHHVGVLPFPDEEKFRVSSPIKLFEYLASGLPILATRVACHTDVLDGRECVVWAESGSVSDLEGALRAVDARRAELPLMSAIAREEAPRWSWHSSARRLLEAIREGLARESPDG